MKYIHKIAVVAVVIVPLVVAGCTLRYDYEPVSPQGVQQAQWSEKLDGVIYLVERSGYSAGSRISQELVIKNQTDKAIVVLEGHVTANQRTYDAEIINNAQGLESRTVPPFKSRTIELSLNLDKPVNEVFGEEIKWAWRIRAGQKEHTWGVAMRRARK